MPTITPDPISDHVAALKDTIERLDTVEGTVQLAPPPMLRAQIQDVSNQVSRHRVEIGGLKGAVGTLTSDHASSRQSLREQVQNLARQTAQSIAAVQGTVPTRGELLGLQNTINSLAQQFAANEIECDSRASAESAQINQLGSAVSSLQQQLGAVNNLNASMEAALAGDAHWIVSANPTALSAAVLNAAAEGTITVPITITLAYGTSDNQHLCANFAPNLIPEKTGEGFDLPIFLPAPTLIGGTKTFDVVLATDEGDEQIYASGNSIVLPVKVSADDKWLGYTVTHHDFTIAIVA